MSISPITKVDELRRRAESCDPNADDTDGLLWWVEGGDDAGGRQGLTDVDLLRFVMFRYEDDFDFLDTCAGTDYCAWP